MNQLKKPKHFDVDRARQDFPALFQHVRGNPLVYFDNSATTQKPKQVIEAVQNYYCYDNANIHRGVHSLSERATLAYEAAREKVRTFIHAAHQEEVIFVRGTTEGINLVAQCFARKFLREGDEIVISAMEHHSNIVPWQMACEYYGAKLKVIPVLDSGELDMEAYQNLLSDRTRLVAVTHASNVIGTINPIQRIIELAHKSDIPVLIDGAQAAAHLPVDVQALDCDFYVFSGHKLYAPTGIGVLYGKKKWLDQMPPYQGGGSMIYQVRFDGTQYAGLPHKFEAGTPNIAGAIGLGAAIDYIQAIGLKPIAVHEQELFNTAIQMLNEQPNLRVIGSAKHRAPVISFVMEGVHPHDIGTILDAEGVAVRAGHHCAQPLMERFGVPATVRVSFALYNSLQELDALQRGLNRVRKLFMMRSDFYE